MKEYIDFMFEDEESGEEFFVELDYNPETTPDPITELYPKAVEIAKENSDKPKFMGVVDADYAEQLGLNTY